MLAELCAWLGREPILLSVRGRHEKDNKDSKADTLAEPYNFKALGADQHAGALHPLNKVRSEFRLVESLPSPPFRPLTLGWLY